MGELPTVHRMPDAEYDAFGAAVQKDVRRAMRRHYDKHMRKPTLLEASVASGVAAIIEGASLLHAISASQEVAERVAFAYLRGAIRGLEHPINDDGSPYTGAFDA